MEKQCKRCRAPLPDGEIVGSRPCPECGALYGVLPEVTTLIERLQRDEDPETLPLLDGLTVKWTSLAPGPGAFREATDSLRAHVVIQHVQRSRSSEWPAMVLAFLLFAAVPWLFYRGGFQVWLLFPMVVASGLAYLILGRLTFLSRVVIDDEHLTHTSRGHASFRTTTLKLPVRNVRQLYVVKPEPQSPPATYELRARTEDGTSRTIVDDVVNPDLLLIYESLVEHALGITDEAIDGELDRHVPTKRYRVDLLFGLVPGICIVALSALYLEVRGSPLEPIYLSDKPHESAIDLARPSTLFFSSWLYFSKPKPVGTPFGSVADLERATLMHIEVSKDGQPLVTRTCDPYDLRWVNFTGANEEYAFFFGGYMRNCSFELPPGSYTLRAIATKNADHPDETLFKQRLEPRVLRRLW